MTTTTTTYAVCVDMEDIRRDPDPSQAMLFFTFSDFFPIFRLLFGILLSAWYIFTIILFPRMEKAVDGEAHTQKNSVAASRKSDLRS